VIDYFQILQLPKTATLSQINESYQRISKQYYNHTPEFLALIDQAFNILSDPYSKEIYIKKLNELNSINQKVYKNPYQSFKPVDLVGNFVAGFFIAFLGIFILTAILVTALN
jgi:curved DNA-binding protein CbpA